MRRRLADLEQGAADLHGWQSVEPDTLGGARQTWWEKFRKSPWPNKRSEEWRYTDPSKIGFGDLAPAPKLESDDRVLEQVDGILERSGDRAGVVVQSNGRIIHSRLDPRAVEAGVVLCSLPEAVSGFPELLCQTLLDAEVEAHEAKLWALHLALLHEGYFLHVPKGVEVHAPVHVFHFVEGHQVVTSAHSFVRVGQAGRVGVVDEFLSNGAETDAVSLHGATLLADPGSRLDYVTLQRFGHGLKQFSMQHAVADRDARALTFNVGLGGSISRTEVTSNLVGPGSESQMLALWFGDGNQHFDHHTLQHHQSPHAHSDLLFKGALNDDASSVFRGLIRVDPKAQLTDAYQTNRNLLLSSGANATALPNLEIQADDVRCSHGATIGQVEEGQLFYLMSRGLTRQQAEHLLVLGFSEEVLGRLPMEGVRARVWEVIEEKLGL